MILGKLTSGCQCNTLPIYTLALRCGYTVRHGFTVLPVDVILDQFATVLQDANVILTDFAILP